MTDPQISLPKTKTMRTGGMDDTLVTQSGSQIEDVQSVKYRGSIINTIEESSKEIWNRISSAWNVFLQLKTRFGRVEKSLHA